MDALQMMLVTPNHTLGDTDAHSIQQAINKAVETGVRKVVVPRINGRTGRPLWEIDETILLPSDFYLVLDNCVLRMADGVFCNMFRNASCGNESLRQDGVQKNIIIEGAGNAVLDGGNHNGLTERTSETGKFPNIVNNTTLLFHNVVGFRVSGLRIVNPRWWGMTYIHCAEGRIADIDFCAMNNAPNQDGIDLRIGCHDITIENITGKTGDDTIALTALLHKFDFPWQVPGQCNDIRNIVIRNVRTEVTGGHHIVRLLNHDGNQLHDIMIDTIVEQQSYGDNNARAALKIGDSGYYSLRPCAPGETCRITARNIICHAKQAVYFNGYASECRLENIQMSGYGGNAIAALDAELEHILVDGVHMNVELKNSGANSERQAYLFYGERTRGHHVVIKNAMIEKARGVCYCSGGLVPQVEVLTSEA